MLVRFAAVLTLAGLASAVVAQEHEHASSPGATERLGTVHFATSCRPDAQKRLDRAVALLHSFEFAAASDAFESTARADPSCGIAYWGVALASWGNPFAAGQKAPKQ